MTPTVLVWLEFALCALLITVAGSRLSRYGDVKKPVSAAVGSAWYCWRVQPDGLTLDTRAPELRSHGGKLRLIVDEQAKLRCRQR